MFKSALLALKPAGTSHEAIERAWQWSERHGLELSAGTVIDAAYLAPPTAVPLGGGAFKHDRDVAILAAAHEAARQTVEAFELASQRRGAQGRALLQEGDTAAMLATQAQEHDLLLVGHSGGDDTGDESLLVRILKHVARPAVIFPNHPVADGDIVVAYDGSPQAARALASFAYSGLGTGRAVHLVSCCGDRLLASARIAAAGRFLARHGIQAQARAVHGDEAPAETLLAEVDRSSAGLLVMGAFGKSAVREFLFGSVTRRVLHTLPVPVFIDH